MLMVCCVPFFFFSKNIYQTTVGVQAGENRPFSAINQGNRWMENLDLVWNSHPIRNIEPLFRVGSLILYELLSLPSIIPLAASNSKGGIELLGSPTRGITRPTTSLIMEDMKTTEEFNAVDFITRIPEEGVGFSDFITSMYSALSSKPWIPGTRVYGVLDVPATIRGIGSCKLQEDPFDRNPSCIVQGEWSTVWTPPGAITHPHIDFYGPAQYMVHFHGEKLWILWPPTPNNLEWYSQHHRQVSAETLTIQAIRNLEGLHVQHFDGSSEEAFLVSPNYIHAVLSVSESAHCSTRVWRIEDFDEAEGLIKWGFQWCANSSQRGVTKKETLVVLETISEDLSWWMSLVEGKKAPNFRSIKKRLGFLIAEEESLRCHISNVSM